MSDEHHADDQTEQQLAATVPANEEIQQQSPSEEERAARHATWWKERQERAEALVNDSRRSWAALQGWDAVTSQEEWDATMDRTVEEWHSGELFIAMLGGRRYLDPPHTALMYHLWHQFVGTYRPVGPAEYLAIAMALFAFHHLVRVNEFVGNMATRLEFQFFDTAPLQVRLTERDGTPKRAGQRAQVAGREALEQFERDALPLMDRLNRMVIRNLKALRDLQAAPLALSVQNYGQLNVGQQQANSIQPPANDHAGTSRPRAGAARRQARKRST